MMNFTKTAAITLAISVGLTACGTSLDRDGTVEGLMANGMSRTQAECIYDDSFLALGEERLLELNDEEITETAGERAQLDAIRDSCVGS